MPQVMFMAWINKNDDTDPGHLLMFMENGFSLEYGWGGDVAKNHSKSVGTSVKSGDQSWKARDLVVTQKSFAKSVQLQAQRTRGNVIRFTQVMCTEPVDITDEELAYLRKMAALRIAAGTYSFLKELMVKDPLATRCLSSLEDLAVQRKQKLGVGRAHDLLKKFTDLNNLAFKLITL
jgi:hypothetical protein